MIIDAGGGTVDLSSYHFLPSTSASSDAEEIAPPDCERASDYSFCFL